MARVKRGVTTHARHQKVIKAAKGYYGARKNLFTVATQAVEKASQYAYRDRRNKKRNFRGLWICLLYTSPSPRDYAASRMPSSA